MAGIIATLLGGLGAARTDQRDRFSWILTPLTWVREQIQASRQSGGRLAANAVIVRPIAGSGYVAAGVPAGARLSSCLAIFAAIAIVIAVMLTAADCRSRRAVGRLAGDAGGLGHRHRRLDAGRHRAGARPALAFRSIRACSIVFIEFWRGVPLITVLFMANLHAAAVPAGRHDHRPLAARADRRGAVLRRLHGRGGARRPAGHPARAGRGGDGARPDYWQTMALIVMPQALRHVIPGIVNTFIGLFKDTTLVLIVGMFDLLGIEARVDPIQTGRRPPRCSPALPSPVMYFIFCFGMSRYSLFVERRLNGHRRN